MLPGSTLSLSLFLPSGHAALQMAVDPSEHLAGAAFKPIGHLLSRTAGLIVFLSSSFFPPFGLGQSAEHCALPPPGHATPRDPIGHRLAVNMLLVSFSGLKN